MTQAKLYDASDNEVATVGIGGDMPSLVRWHDRIFMLSAQLFFGPAPEPRYVETVVVDVE